MRRVSLRSSATYLFRAAPGVAGQRAMGSAERLIRLNVNGHVRHVDVMKQETLAMTLRYKLGLTGTKLGCDRAECGACTVLIDDVPHYSCSVLTHTVRSKQIVTIEGLADSPERLHPVQRGVVDEHGFQCAFCMPGFIMAAVGFLKTNPDPYAKRACAWRVGQSLPLSGLQQDNHRVDARRRVRGRAQGPGRTDGAVQVHRLRLHNARPCRKCTGRARYAEDFRAEGMLFCRLLLSPMPHARIRRIMRQRRWRCQA